MSPGGSSERIFLFYAQVNAALRTGAGGGLETEHEDVRVLSLPLSEARAQIADGRLQDAKTLVGLQWLLLQPHQRPGYVEKAFD
ncbi:MAG: hypothetical protein HC915_19380 [Anaerolineae bacterium]|nr:hypothetical protein [Anaerolineae bacterium]